MNERFEQDCGDCIDKECKNTGIVGRTPDLDTCQVVNEAHKPEAVKSKSNDGLCQDLENRYKQETGDKAQYGKEPHMYPGRMDYYYHDEYVEWLEELIEKLEA